MVQYQQLPVAHFLILLRKAADLQKSMRIWAATLAIVFRALSRQLFLGGGVMFLGPQGRSFALSKVWSFIWVVEEVRPFGSPSRQAISFSGVPL